VVDWRVCRTGDPNIDVEVPATHIGLVFNPIVYDLVAQRLAESSVPVQKAAGSNGKGAA
jgi:hypothetical protein